MTVGTSFYHVVVPVEKTNLIGNPSFEVGNIGWEGTANINTAGSVVFGTAASAQAFGAWSARVTGATGTFGIRSPIVLTSPLMRVGTSYTASAYVRVLSPANSHAPQSSHPLLSWGARGSALFHSWWICALCSVADDVCPRLQPEARVFEGVQRV